jgi:hypothetical protein
LLQNEGLDLSRMDSGTRTVLTSVPHLITNGVDYELKLVVRGTDPVQVEGWIDGTKVMDYSDTSSSRIQSAGGAGFWNGSDVTEFDDILVADPEPLPDPTADTVLASEDFSSCADFDPPSSSLWETSGTWYCRTQRLRGESADGIALMPGISANNAKMRARVQPSASAADNSGVMVRVGSGAYYAARLDVTNQKVVLDKVTPSGTERLDEVPYTIAVETSYRLELSAIGWNPVELEVSVESVSQMIDYDEDSTTQLHGPSVGLISGTNNRTQYDDVFVYSQ